MRSMTGFGSGSGNDGKLAVTIEMRAVNQRFLELNIRMPHAYLALEDRLRSGIKAVLKRGKVDVILCGKLGRRGIHTACESDFSDVQFVFQLFHCIVFKVNLLLISRLCTYVFQKRNRI